MTINDYFENQKEVYVRNRTRPLGIISMALGEKEDRDFSIPKSTLPIIMTNYIPKKQIEESMSFRQLVSKNIIELLTEKQYNEIMESNAITKAAVEAEVQKLQEKKVELSDEASQVTELDDNSPQINSRVLQLAHLLSMKGKSSDVEGALPSQDAVIGELETMVLNEADLSFLTANSRGKVRKWSNEQLNKIYSSK